MHLDRPKISCEPRRQNNEKNKNAASMTKLPLTEAHAAYFGYPFGIAKEYELLYFYCLYMAFLLLMV